MAVQGNRDNREINQDSFQHLPLFIGGLFSVPLKGKGIFTRLFSSKNILENNL
jgi:hypothetical protein